MASTDYTSKWNSKETVTTFSLQAMELQSPLRTTAVEDLGNQENTAECLPSMKATSSLAEAGGYYSGRPEPTFG